MNKNLIIFTIIIVLLFTLSINSFATLEELSVPSQNIQMEKQLMEEKSNQLIIKLNDRVNLSSTFNLLNMNYLSNDEIIDLGNNTRIVNVEGEFKEEIIKELESDPSIEYVESNYIYYQDNILNDTYYHNLWHLNNINAEAAWKQIAIDSDDVVVAVIDSGIDYTHKDLINRIEPGGYNFLYNDNSIYDYDGHGTFISGIIAAEANNNYGIAGLAENSNIKILPIRVTNYLGESSSIDIIKAINYCISKNVDVINLSMGGPQYSKSFNDAIQRAINSNIVVVASSGNHALEGNPINYPASYEGVISVGSTNSGNQRSYFSNYNNYVDIVAPGEYIFSTSTDNKFSYGSGTSYSTPMVAATAALLRTLEPNLSVGKIREILTTTALDLGAKGKDIYYGYGLLDMNAAIKKVATATVPIDEYLDYKFMNVSNSKVFNIEFDYQLLNSSLEGNIYASSSKDGKVKNIPISLGVSNKNNRIVTVEPITVWAKGYNYLFINDEVRGIDGRRHKNKLRITFYVN